MPTNTFITPTVVANEFLMQLESALVMGNLVHRGFSKEFVKVGDTITVKRPATFTAEAVQSGMSVQGVAESNISLKIDHRDGVLVSYTAEDAAMKITDFNTQITIPAVRAIAEKVDTNLMALARDIPYTREQSATAVLADFALLAADLATRKCPMEDGLLNLVMDPMSYAKYMSIEAIASLAARGNTDAVAKGQFKEAMGFNIGRSQQVATEGTLVGSLTGCSTPTPVALGAVTMTVTDTDATTGLLPHGYVFTIQGDTQVYTLTADATQTATGCVIYFAPGIQIAISGAKTITGETVVSSGKTCSLAFHKNAIALVTVPEAPSQSCPSKVLFSNGLNVMLTYERDTTNHIDTMLFEILYGVKVLDHRMAERFLSD
jgi:hypothetical protein